MSQQYPPPAGYPQQPSYPQQGYPQQAPPPYGGPTTQVSYRKMGWIAGGFHITMMVFTMGLWTPIYLWARRGRKTVTRTR